ncbi:MAG: YdbH domain-containing protein [Rhodospirillales bacterium]
MRTSALALIFVAVAAAAVGGAYLAIPWVGAWALSNFLSARGFPDATFRIDSIGLTQVTVTEIDLGAGSNVRVRELGVSYSPGRLANGVIDGIRIEQPEVPLAIGASGVDPGPLGKLLSAPGNDTSARAVRLIGPITVSAGLLRITTPLGDVEAAVEGVVLLTDGIGTDANLQFALQHPKARLSGRARGILDSQDRLQFAVDIQNAASDARVAFTEMKGAVNISGTLSGAMQGGGSLTLQDVAVDGIALGNVDLAGDVDGKAATAELLLGGAGTGLSMQVRAETDDIFDPAAQLRLTGEAATDGLKGPFALPVPLDAVGALDFDIAGSRRDLQALPAGVAANAVRAADGITGTVSMMHLGLTAATGANATVNGTLELAVDSRGWRLRPSGGLDLDLGLPGSGQRFDLSLAGAGDVPFMAGGPTAADPLRIAMDYRGVFNGRFPFSGDAGGTLWPATTDGLMFENVALRFDPWEVKAGGMEIVAERVGVRLSGPLRQLDLDVTADVRLSGSPWPGVSVSGGRTSFSADVAYGPEGIRIFPQGCTVLRATGIAFGQGTLRPGPLSVCPRTDAVPLVHAVTGAQGLKRIDLALVLNSAEIALDGVGPYPLNGTLPRFEGTASYDSRRGTWWAKFDADGGNLKAAGLDLAVTGLDGGVSLEGKDTLLGARADLKAVDIADTRRPVRVQPVRVAGKGKYRPSAAGFTGEAGFQDGPRAEIDVQYDVPESRGTVKIDLPAWTFAAGGPQPQDFFPVLKGVVTDVSGRLGAAAQLAWTGDDISSTATVSLTDVAFGTTPAEVKGVNGVIEIADLVNLKTATPQTLTVGLLDAGMPLSDGRVTFELPGGNRAHIVNASWPVSGGVLEINDLDVSFDRPPDVIVADLKNLNAAHIARNMEIDGLEAEGRLAGRIPVRITEDGPVIDDARIWSLHKGALRFRSQVALESLRQSGEMADLLANALSDFRYTDLQMSLNGPLSGDITAKAKINGANPALYGGKPIELNVALQGALRDLLQSASVIQDLPGNIRDQMQGPSGKP